MTLWNRVFHPLVLAVLGLTVLACGEALAGDDDEDGVPFSLGPVDFRATFDTSAAALSVKNAQFGNGSTSRSNERAGGRTWYEGFARPGLEFETHSYDLGELYGRASVVGQATRGAGEAQATSTTSDQPAHTALDEAFIGWRSGLLMEDWLQPNALDLSAGQQDFTVGDGFLITKGTSNGSGRAAYYLGPQFAFEKTAILKINTEPVRADIFHLEGNVDQKLMRGGDNPDTKLYGANVEWFKSKTNDEGRTDYGQRLWYVGLTGLKVYDSDHAFSFAGSQGGAAQAANRDGLVVTSARLGGSFIPGFEDLAVYSEYAKEHNNTGGNGGSVSAAAWYVQPQYTASMLPWSPMVTARYAHFSGDGNAGDKVDRSWDPLFSDAGPRGGNTWTQGAIYSQYVGANTNLNSVYLGSEVTPVKDVLNLGVAYFHHDFAEASQATATAKHLMDEVDLYVTWTTPIPNLVISPTLAAGMPGKGQEQSLGLTDESARTIWLGQVVLSWKL